MENFGASATRVSFGRYQKSSIDDYDFVPMSVATPGAANSGPKVGPIVISEIMYNPDWPPASAYTNDQYEYVELHNISAEPVALFRYEKGRPWKFVDGIDYTFPEDTPVTLAPGGYLLVVKNPQAFSIRYPRVPAEIILGPYDGKLNNAGEKLELAMPGDVTSKGERSYIRIDRVNYSDGSHPDDVPGAVDKALTDARHRLTRVLLDGDTIPHKVVGRFESTRVLLRPAGQGTGVIAGAAVRAVVEAAGIGNVLTKVYGSRNAKNVVKATINALTSLRSKEEVERLRGVTIE